MSDVKHITNDDFQQLLKKEGYAVLDLYAEWCPPCKMMAPIFENLSKDEALKDMDFVKVDVDKEVEIASTFQVMSIPTFVIIKSKGDGTYDEIKKIVGGQDPLTFKQTLIDALKS